jgi:hypothetical protein
MPRRYPCRWRWRGFFLQMILTTPCRRITLQFSQMGLTELRTFMTRSSSTDRG